MARMNLRDHYRSGTPFIAVHDAAAALAFYEAAFDAEVLARLEAPGGRVMHAAVLVRGSLVVVADEMPEVGLRSPRHYGGAPFSILLNCADAAAAVAQAVAEGADLLAPVQDTFSGDRHGLVRCPYGHRWILSTRTEDLTFAEVQERFTTWLAGGAPVETTG